MDKSAVIFGNKIDKKTVAKAEKSKNKYIKKFGDDSGADYYLGAEKIQTLDFLGAVKGVLSDKPYEFPENALIVGDSLSSDIAGGKNYGITTVWFNLHNITSSLPDYVVRSFTELYDLLKRLSK